MKATLVLAASMLLSVVAASPASAQSVFKIETGAAFNKAVPRDFVLEENSIPVEKRNSVLAFTSSGARMIVGLLDTSGYRSQVQEKYLGMLIAEGSVAIGGHEVALGSYGFGIARRAGAAGAHAARFILYNQGGRKVMECPVERDAKMVHPRPLQVVAGGNGTARLYLGREWVELK